MKEYRIYTCGKMSGISYEEQMVWRRTIEDFVRQRTDKCVTFIHPPMYYSYEEVFHKSEREIQEWEITALNKCDIVIVNLPYIESSIGSHMELGAAYVNKNIHVIGVGKPTSPLHPWIENTCLRIEEDYEKAAEYIVDYLLI